MFSFRNKKVKLNSKFSFPRTRDDLGFNFDEKKYMHNLKQCEKNLLNLNIPFKGIVLFVSGSIYLVTFFNRKSAPPFEKSLYPVGNSVDAIKVDILFLFELNGICFTVPLLG